MLNRDTERDWLNYESWRREKRNALEKRIEARKKELEEKEARRNEVEEKEDSPELFAEEAAFQRTPEWLPVQFNIAVSPHTGPRQVSKKIIFFIVYKLYMHFFTEYWNRQLIFFLCSKIDPEKRMSFVEDAMIKLQFLNVSQYGDQSGCLV